MNIKSIISNIKFINILKCSKQDKNYLLKIRNEDEIRIQMFNKKKININEHLKWISDLNNKKKKMYCIFFKRKLIGGLAVRRNAVDPNKAEWGFYVSKKKIILGMGAFVEYSAINYIFSKYYLKELYCFVKKSNISVLKLHKKFGFKKVPFKDTVYEFHLPKNIKNILALKLSKIKWDENKKLILKI